MTPLITTIEPSNQTKMKMIRHLVSGSNARFQEDGIDLDLTYITPRIIAMGFPSTGFEASYRNPAQNVASFLDERHHGFYKVYNLSERCYHQSIFSGPVEFFPFPDHHAPTFQLLLDVIKSMQAWLAENPDNVVVVHCIAGHGRTGTVICGLLQFEGLCSSPRDALEAFAQTRSVASKGVGHPSQRRYVEYVGRHLQTCGEDRYVLHNVESAWIRRVQITNVLKKPKEQRFQVIIFDGQWDVKWNSSWLNPLATMHSDAISVEPNVLVRGDFTVKLFAVGKLSKKSKELLRSSMNLNFVRGDAVAFCQMDLDGPHKDKKNEKFDPRIILRIDIERVTSE